MTLPRPHPGRQAAPRRLAWEPLEDRAVPSVSSAFAFGLTATPRPGDTWAEVVTTRVAADPAGNAYVAGHFYGSVDFDPTDPADLPGTAGDTLYSSGAGVQNHTAKGFLAKYDPAGRFQWVHRFGQVVNDIAVDAAGDVYAVGNFASPADDPTADDFGPIPLTALGYEDVFAAKVAAAGSVAWATRAGGGLQHEPQDSGRGIALDAAGDPYICGSFGGAADFGTTTLTAAGGYPAAFVARLSPADGSFVWAKGTRFVSGSGPVGDAANALAVDGEGRVSVTGEFRGTVDFDPGAGTTTLGSVNRRGGFSSADAFVWQLNAEKGAFRWARAVGGSGLDAGRDLAVDGGGNIYSAGPFEVGVDFDPGKGKYTLLGGGQYLLKLDSAGAFAWARGGAGVPIGDQVALDAAGAVYLTGTFSGTADFDPGPGAYSLTSAGGTDAFVLKLDGNANFVWAVSAGGAGDDRGAGVGVSGTDVWAVGRLSGTADFDPGAGENWLTAPDGSAFVWKLTQE